MTRKTNTVIVEAKRSPMGAFGGALKDHSASELAAAVCRAMQPLLHSVWQDIQHVLMGCVLPAGMGQAPARQVVQKSGLDDAVRALTLNKVCGSGMVGLMWSSYLLQENPQQVILAGGMESMSRAPYLLDGRFGWKFGHRKAVDHMLRDGLEDSALGLSMGLLAEDTAREVELDREAHDAYAMVSAERALAAQQVGQLAPLITPITLKKGMLQVDETLGKVNLEKIPTLRAAFKENGVLTAATSSGLADGACVLALTSEDFAAQKGLKARAVIKGSASFSCVSQRFIHALVEATRQLLAQLDWSAQEVDVWEVNEAFATVPLLFMKELSVPQDGLNRWGGALALGHPLGASGARIVAQLLAVMEKEDVRRGVAAICIGGGEGLALALERPDR
jgi:acetyl-CoA C-acetyltransferase